MPHIALCLSVLCACLLAVPCSAQEVSEAEKVRISNHHELLERHLPARALAKNEQRIRESLNSITTLEFPGNPLSDVIEFLAALHDFPIVLDSPALRESGIEADDEVQLTIQGVTLRSALNLLLNDVSGVKLTYVIQNEVLLITTPKVASHYRETLIYDLRPFKFSDIDNLIRTLELATQSRAPDNSSPSISAFDNRLIINANQPVHDEIERLLKLLFKDTHSQNPSE